MAVDVVVVNYKTPDLLLEFIESFNLHAFEGCTLTIVEVGDETVGVERQWFLQSSLLPPPYSTFGNLYRFSDNVGYAKACNRGASFGTQDVILLANADTQLSEGFQECYEVLISRRDWGVLGPRQTDLYGKITAGGIFGSNRFPKQRGWGELDRGQVSDVRYDAISVSGALYFIKRDLWSLLTHCELYRDVQPVGEKAIGAFLETKLYFEETFASLHARAHGYKCVYYGPVKMIHHWHKSVETRTGWGEEQFKISQAMHREACQHHGIESE